MEDASRAQRARLFFDGILRSIETARDVGPIGTSYSILVGVPPPCAAILSVVISGL